MHDGAKQPRRYALQVDGPYEVIPEDVQAITRAVLSVVTAAETVTRESFMRGPAAGSSGDALLRGDERALAMDSFLVAQYAHLTGFDHARAFVSLLGGEEMPATALATVGRGALESFARSWHVLASGDERELLHRTLCLLRSDLQFPARHRARMQNRNGAPIDPAAERARYDTDLQRLGLPKCKSVSLAAMVAAMLDAASDSDGGAESYSDLSAIAHAHHGATNAFVVADRSGVVGLVAARHIIMTVAVELVASVTVTMSRLVERFGGDDRHRQLVAAASRNAVAALEPVGDSIWPPDPA